MPGRNIVGDYRYGYQGEYAEKDQETGLNAFELRMYDARIGRWISPDPYNQYPSPYMAMDNNPVLVTDPDGGCTDCLECPSACQELGLESIPTGQSIDLNIDDGFFMRDDLNSSMLNEVTVTGYSQEYLMNMPLWDFSNQMQQFQVDAKRIADNGGIPSAYMVQSYINPYENAAYLNGRTYVTAQDIEDVDSAAGEVVMAALPVTRLLNLAGKGYALTRTIGRFTVFEKTVKATNLPGQAVAKYTKVFNQNGKLVKMYKDAYKIDGRHYERAFYKPKSFGRTRKLN